MHDKGQHTGSHFKQLCVYVPCVCMYVSIDLSLPPFQKVWRVLRLNRPQYPRMQRPVQTATARTRSLASASLWRPRHTQSASTDSGRHPQTVNPRGRETGIRRATEIGTGKEIEIELGIETEIEIPIGTENEKEMTDMEEEETIGKGGQTGTEAGKMTEAEKRGMTGIRGETGAQEREKGIKMGNERSGEIWTKTRGRTKIRKKTRRERSLRRRLRRKETILKRTL